MTIRLEYHYSEEKDPSSRIHLITNEMGRIEKMLGAASHEHAAWKPYPSEGMSCIDVTEGWRELALFFREDNSMEVALALEELAYDLYGDKVLPILPHPPLKVHHSPVSMQMGFDVPTGALSPAV